MLNSSTIIIIGLLLLLQNFVFSKDKTRFLEMPEINTFHYRFLKSLLVHGKNK